ncbi:MAG: hypothetical protein KGZ74_12180 [Chitinophagaceae bacterium]|nr:hypothetical protein [Chitinophagaceae bacterium]
MNDELAVVTVFVSAFAAIFGLFYLRNKENMSLIEKGLNPREYTQRPAPYRSLKWGLLLMGAGLGLFLGYVLSEQVMHMDDDNPVMYFSMLAIFGGLGLFLSYKIEKKETIDNKTES